MDSPPTEFSASKILYTLNFFPVKDCPSFPWIVIDAFPLPKSATPFGVVTDDFICISAAETRKVPIVPVTPVVAITVDIAII